MSTLSRNAPLPHLVQFGLRALLEQTGHFEHHETSVLFVSIDGLCDLSQTYGFEVCDRVARAFGTVLQEAIGQPEFPWSNPRTFQLWDDAFGILIPGLLSIGSDSDRIRQLVSTLEDQLYTGTSSFGYPRLRLSYGVSAARLDQKAGTATEQVADLVRLAGKRAYRRIDSIPPNIVHEIERIVTVKDVRIHYQPIFQLTSETPIGWECLSRGPAGSELEHPMALFSYAEQMGHLLDVERICRNTAIRNVQIAGDRKLFLNISPHILSDPSFRPGATRVILEETGLTPEQIVFEITEHHAIREHEGFLRLIEHYRSQGYRVAVDDVGAGHSGLVTLLQVKPDFVKIDMELIRGIETDSMKQSIVRAILQIGAEFQGMIIAEGIETPEELHWLRSNGVQYGQGFLLGRPNPVLAHTYAE